MNQSIKHEVQRDIPISSFNRWEIIPDYTTININAIKGNITILYCRLSQDDKQEGDSNSIINQKKLLGNHALEHHYENPIFFVDDGISGTTFDRPAFIKAIELVEQDKSNRFIIKDMSRFGRDYLKVGLYTEVLFPEHHIHFVALNDGVDSNQGDNEFTPFRNIINEWYAKDTSKKIRAVKQAKGRSGERLTSIPCYGYMKAESNPKAWVIDDESSKVVRMIFNLCLEGYGPTQIGRMMSEKNILNPSHYAQSKGRPTTRKAMYPTYWGSETISDILSKKEYLGHTVNFRQQNTSYKNRKPIYNSEEKHVIFENTHTAIIEPEVFERVQKIRQGKRKNCKSGKIGLFNGIVYCAECKQKLYFSSTIKYPERDHYVCSSYRRTAKTCIPNYTKLSLLEEVVRHELNDACSLIRNHSDIFIKVLQEQTQLRQDKDIKFIKKQLADKKTRHSKLDGIIKQLYEDKLEGTLTYDRFMKLSSEYEAEQKSLIEEIEEIGNQIETQENQSQNIKKFVETTQKYGAIEKLTPSLLHELIDRIEVHKQHKEDGVKVQEIDIYYNFVGMFKVYEVQENIEEKEKDIS